MTIHPNRDVCSRCSYAGRPQRIVSTLLYEQFSWRSGLLGSPSSGCYSLPSCEGRPHLDFLVPLNGLLPTRAALPDRVEPALRAMAGWLLRTCTRPTFNRRNLLLLLRSSAWPFSPNFLILCASVWALSQKGSHAPISVECLFSMTLLPGPISQRARAGMGVHASIRRGRRERGRSGFPERAGQ